MPLSDPSSPSSLPLVDWTDPQSLRALPPAELDRALAMAARHHFLEHLPLAIELGADLEFRDHEGFCPLDFCAHQADADGVRALLAAGANPNPQGAPDGLSPLMRAAASKWSQLASDCCELLLAAGADIRAKSPGGYTAAYMAEATNSPCAKLLAAALEAAAIALATPTAPLPRKPFSL